MKRIFANSLLTASAAALVSCGNLSGPIDTGSFDPLATPGSNFNQENEVPTGPQFDPGSFAQTVIPEAAFFSSFPRGEATANRALPMNSVVKVVGTRKSFVRVELEDGAVGFVPAMMLAPQGEELPVAANEGVAPLVIPGGDLEIPPLPDPGNPEDLGAPVLPPLGDLPAPAELPAPVELPEPAPVEGGNELPPPAELPEPATLAPATETPALPGAPAEPALPEPQ